MTRKDLEQITGLMREVSYYEGKVKGRRMTDTVEGSSPEYPYCKHPISVAGVGDGAKEDLHRLVILRAELNERIRFIDDVEDPRLRHILRLRYIDGIKTWWGIADKMGGGETEASVRQTAYRFFKNS